MAHETITPEARRFLAERISSVAQLELLLLLRTDPQRAWTVADLVGELRVEPAWANQQLTALAENGLLVSQAAPGETAFRFSPRTPELEQAVTAVAQDYLLHRVSVIEFIYSRPSDTIRAFADAFRLRKDPPRG